MNSDCQMKIFGVKIVRPQIKMALCPVVGKVGGAPSVAGWPPSRGCCTREVLAAALAVTNGGQRLSLPHVQILLPAISLGSPSRLWFMLEPCLCPCLEELSFSYSSLACPTGTSDSTCTKWILVSLSPASEVAPEFSS